MKFTLTLSGAMADLITEIATVRGISEQEAVRALLGESLERRRILQQSPAVSRLLQQSPDSSSSLQTPGLVDPPSSPSLDSFSSPPSISPPKKKDMGGVPQLPLSAPLAPVQEISDGRKAQERGLEAEIRWRLDATWQAHLKAWRRYLRKANGSDPTQTPTLHPDDIAKPIRQGLLAHDRHLLGADQRETWERESKVRAAGIGIFYDSWCNGTHRDNDATAGGKKYLEHWRPWKRLHGKPDPIPKFAEIYFELRDANEAAARKDAANG